MKRKKRLAKGIESLKDQITIHEEKLKKAIEDTDVDLIEYYQKDITRLFNEEKKKKDQLGKS